MENLHIFLDLLLLILPLVSIIAGTVKGFTKLVLPFALTVLFMVVAYLYAGPVAKTITTTYLHEHIVSSLASRFTEKLGSGAAVLSDFIPAQILTAVSSGGLTPDTAVNESVIPTLSERIVTAIEPVIIIPVVTVIIYAVIYSLSKLLAAFLIKPAEAISKLPIISSVNRILGFIAGLALGLLRLAIYVAVIAAIIKLMPDGALAKAVSQTQVLCLLTGEIFKLI